MPFVTPEQAKNMRCCKPEFVNCKADECMGWRWKPKETRYVKEGNKVPDGWVLMPDEFGDDLIESPKDGRKYHHYEKTEEEKIGYCGIAGHVTTCD